MFYLNTIWAPTNAFNFFGLFSMHDFFKRTMKLIEKNCLQCRFFFVAQKNELNRQINVCDAKTNLNDADLSSRLFNNNKKTIQNNIYIKSLFFFSTKDAISHMVHMVFYPLISLFKNVKTRNYVDTNRDKYLFISDLMKSAVNIIYSSA